MSAPLDILMQAGPATQPDHHQPGTSRHTAAGGQYEVTIASLEDKIVQRAVCEVLNAVYEADFKGFSYGFRPGRSQHDALDALSVGLATKVNWVLDLDVQAFLDA